MRHSGLLCSSPALCPRTNPVDILWPAQLPGMDSDMPEASPAQGTLKRLIEAEEQAREILKAAEERAQESLAQARREAQQSVDAVRQQAARQLQSQLEGAESKAASELKTRLDQAEDRARQFENRAAENLSGAVDIVVDWVTGGDD